LSWKSAKKVAPGQEKQECKNRASIDWSIPKPEKMNQIWRWIRKR